MIVWLMWQWQWITRSESEQEKSMKKDKNIHKCIVIKYILSCEKIDGQQINWCMRVSVLPLIVNRLLHV